jgi:large repetitive protein
VPRVALLVAAPAPTQFVNLVAEPTAVAVAALKLAGSSSASSGSLTAAAVFSDSTKLNVVTVITNSARQFSFTVPCVTVSRCDANDRPIFAARADDDGPLPQWLSFDPYTGTFTGKAPANTVTLKVKISTVGASGSATWTALSLNFSHLKDMPSARP